MSYCTEDVPGFIPDSLVRIYWAFLPQNPKSEQHEQRVRAFLIDEAGLTEEEMRYVLDNPPPVLPSPR